MAGLGSVRDQPGPERAELLAYIGTVRLRNGDHQHAERMLRESLELQRQSSGAADANSEIFTLQNLGSLLLIRRRYEEATAVFNQALERADSTETPLRPG